MSRWESFDANGDLVDSDDENVVAQAICSQELRVGLLGILWISGPIAFVMVYKFTGYVLSIFMH